MGRAVPEARPFNMATVDKIVSNAIKKGWVSLEGLVLIGKSMKRLTKAGIQLRDDQEVRCLGYKDKNKNTRYSIVFLDTVDGAICAAVWMLDKGYKWVGYTFLT